MYISRETPEQTQARLLQIIAAADFRPLEGLYSFEEHPVKPFPGDHARGALAIVRDEQVWSLLVPATDQSGELFALFSFHFAPRLDNSGFVGWLASHLKSTLGTGVFVVCGQNTERGGIYDYWGVPASVARQAVAEIERLRLSGNSPNPSSHQKR